MSVENEICISTSHRKKKNKKKRESKNIIQLSTSHGKKKQKKERERERGRSKNIIQLQKHGF